MSCDWRDLTWQEYSMRLWHWNDRHGDHDVPMIDPVRARAAFNSAALH